jgi:4-amino-4-deoxyprephenate dehydrogenase
MSTSHIPAINAVVLGGSGAMGALFCRMLVAEGVHVTVIDLISAAAGRPAGVDYLSADVGNLTGDARAALAGADWVIATLPETVMLAAWPSIVGCQKPGSLFVDTLSVKKPLFDAMADQIPSIEAISINPMFAPSVGFQGQSVAIIELCRGHHADTFLKMLETWGAVPNFLTADNHDRYAAMLQSGTHAAILAFGLSLHRLHYDLSAISPIMTPPHRALLALLARILSASPETYWDIQSQNPYAAEARQALLSSVTELSRLIDDEDQAGFFRLLADLRELYGEEQLDEFNRYCARMFQARD